MLGATNAPQSPKSAFAPPAEAVAGGDGETLGRGVGAAGPERPAPAPAGGGDSASCHTVSPFLTSCHSESPSVTLCPHPACPPMQVQQKQHRDTVAVYRSHLLHAAQVGPPGPAGGWKHSSVCQAPRWDPGKSHTPSSAGIHGRGRSLRAAADPAGRGRSGAVALNRETATHTWPASHSVTRSVSHAVSSSQGRACTLLHSPPEILGPPSPFLGYHCPHSNTDSDPVGIALFPVPPAEPRPPPPQREFGAGADALQVGAAGRGPAQEDPGGNLGAPGAVGAQLGDPGTGTGLRDGAMGRLDSLKCSPASCPLSPRCQECLTPRWPAALWGLIPIPFPIPIPIPQLHPRWQRWPPGPEAPARPRH